MSDNVSETDYYPSLEALHAICPFDHGCSFCERLVVTDAEDHPVIAEHREYHYMICQDRSRTDCKDLNTIVNLIRLAGRKGWVSLQEVRRHCKGMGGCRVDAFFEELCNKGYIYHPIDRPDLWRFAFYHEDSYQQNKKEIAQARGQWQQRCIEAIDGAGASASESEEE